MNKQVLSTISAVLIVGVAVFAILFFWGNPFRVGEITLGTPNGSSMTIKVANSNDISTLMQNGLKNEKTADALANALLAIIEGLSATSPLGKKLVELAEHRRSPFSCNSKPVKLVYDSKVDRGFAAVCEKSEFLTKNIVVFVLADNNELLDRFTVYADKGLMFPCPDGVETIRLNYPEVQQYLRHQVLAKLNL